MSMDLGAPTVDVFKDCFFIQEAQIDSFCNLGAQIDS